MTTTTTLTRIAFTLGFALAFLLLSGPSAEAAPNGKTMLKGAHGDRRVMPKSCRACHRGMMMALDGEEGVCLTCHGSATGRQTMRDRGYLRGQGRDVELGNIAAELSRPYSHPVLSVKGVHRSYEVLPEREVTAPRHSECVDCHEPHLVEEENPFRGLPGRRVGNFVAEIEKEYELCYKCHSSSANLPVWSTNKHAEFKPTNPSYHPIEEEGKNAYVISLKDPYVARKERPEEVSMISCRDCHGSDDPNAPAGPHGSNYRGLLTDHYEMEDGRPESEFAYELCYKCHSRSSILGNESFPYHSLHIEGRSGFADAGTSCFTCHDAHGSTEYQYLIRFNEDVVEPNADDKLEFDARGVASRHGSCYLNCHGVEHNPKSY